MNSKLTYSLVVLFALVGCYLFYKNQQLEKKVNELTTTKEPVSITPLTNTPAAQTANSPFDQPHVDQSLDLPAETPDTNNVAAFSFDKSTHNFGKIKEGVEVHHTFNFTNTGKMPMSIIDAQGSCGCTVPTWPKEPILPGKKGKIEVVFNSKGKSGEIEKTVTIHANTHPANTVLYIKATVAPKPE